MVYHVQCTNKRQESQWSLPFQTSCSQRTVIRTRTWSSPAASRRIERSRCGEARPNTVIPQFLIYHIPSWFVDCSLRHLTTYRILLIYWLFLAYPPSSVHCSFNHSHRSTVFPSSFSLQDPRVNRISIIMTTVFRYFDPCDDHSILDRPHCYCIVHKIINANRIIVQLLPRLHFQVFIDYCNLQFILLTVNKKRKQRI